MLWLAAPDVGVVALSSALNPVYGRTQMAITIRTISEAFAAECVGIDLSAPINDPTLGKIKDAFAAHPVLLFRGQSLTPEQQIAYSRKFGELEIHVSKQYLLSEHPEILLLTNERNPDGSRISIAEMYRNIARIFRH